MTNLQSKNTVKVSVHMPAYNHEHFIAHALDSVLMQKVNFNYEIVIGEDCSTDNTKSVALKYAKRHPSKIQVIENEKNLGIWETDRKIINACKGKYIAWLESDDYWISPNKLQNQVDFLDQNGDFSACFHRARHLGEKPITWQNGPPQAKPFYTLDDLLKDGHFIPSCTAVFRNELVRAPMEWTRQTPFLETSYCIKFALNGKIGFLDEEMAVFRFNPQGIYGTATNVENIEAAIATHKLLGEYFKLTELDSYRQGLVRLYIILGRELAIERRPFLALGARCRAIWQGRSL